jgi:hypothetical protein
MRPADREVLGSLALRQAGVGPWGQMLLGTVTSDRPRAARAGGRPAHGARPRTRGPSPVPSTLREGERFEVLDRTTGWTRRYRVLDDLGYDEYRVRIETGVYEPRRMRRARFRPASRITSVLGGPTLAVLRKAGHL